jgi:hypothetical protein
VQQVDESLVSARRQAKSLQTGTRSFWAGARAAWKAWAQETKPAARKRPKSLSHRPTSPRLTRPQRSPDASSSVSQADQNRPSPRLPSAPHSAQESPRYPRQPHVAPPEAAAHNRADPAHQHQNMDNLQVPDPWAEPDRHPRRPPQNDVERSASALPEATTTEPDSANPSDD